MGGGVGTRFTPCGFINCKLHNTLWKGFPLLSVSVVIFSMTRCSWRMPEGCCVQGRADHPPSGPPQTGLGLKNGLLFPLAPSDFSGLYWCSRTCAAWTLVFQLLFELLSVPGAQEENLGSLPAQILYTFHLLSLWPTAEEAILKDVPPVLLPETPSRGRPGWRKLTVLLGCSSL